MASTQLFAMPAAVGVSTMSSQLHEPDHRVGELAISSPSQPSSTNRTVSTVLWRCCLRSSPRCTRSRATAPTDRSRSSFSPEATDQRERARPALATFGMAIRILARGSDRSLETEPGH